MPEAQGISKTLAFKAQSGLGVPANGSGGQKLRRRTATFTLARDTYSSDEIVSHQQSTGATAGMRRASGSLSALLSAGSYSALLANLLRKVFVATSAITGLSVTIAGAGPTYTVTRAAGDFLAGGIKIGDVVRLTAGSFNAANINHNMIVVGATATVLTVRPLNGVALVAEGPIASATLSVPGKKTLVPTTGHTNEYLTFEEWYPDVTRSELWTDFKVGQASFNLPATGNAEVNFDLVGLNRTRGSSQVLTSPSAETTSSVLTSVNGLALLGGSVVAITGAQVTIAGSISPSDAEVGSNQASDLQKGRIMVTGQFTSKFTGVAAQDLYENQNAAGIVLVVADDQDNDADFVTLNMSRVKIFSDTPDDGEKSIVRTYSFTAEINGAGGAALANDNTIISIQDSLAA